METKTCYVKLLHLFLLFISVQFSNALFAQAIYEGFGANAVGGSNSTTVYHVTNTNSSGAGSLANGIGSNKTIVFDVSGTIIGRFDLINITYLTIDATGQTIVIDNQNNGDAVSFDGANTHHCILKNLHVTNAGGDGINVIDGSHDILITNCTSWGNRDGNIDVAGDNAGQTKNVTVQWCIVGGGAPNNTSYSGCTLITGQNVTLHHNLYVPYSVGNVGERNPLVHCNYSPVGAPNADIRNNVVWKYGRNNGTGSGYGTAVAYNAAANVINNYYYTAGTSPNSATNTDDGYGGGATGKAYIAGNVSGNNGVNANADNNHAIYTVPAVTTQDACTAAQLVLANAGPSPRNATDLAFISQVTLPNCSTSGNLPPTANAGADQTITLPTSSTNLQGSGTDADGTIASYAWTKLSGPATFTIGTPNAAITTLTNLLQGTYVFRLTVTDNGGATATDDVTVTVNAAVNLPPTANAGSDITITLPTNSTTLLGSGTDADGTIASYGWARVSGPTTFTLGAANAATTALTNLVQGTYIFRLTVTDNAGATGIDNVTVIVNPAVNQPPTANAGADITLTLPTNSTTLNGSGTDADGTIASYLWARVSGPATFTLGSPNAATTTLTGLVQGTYIFRLTVTDNSGATGTDNVTIIVNAAPNQPPTANAGSDITITLPTNSVTLVGSGTDPDGTIASYAWTKASGPAGGTLGSPNAATTTVTGLTQGTYVFTLTVTDNNGATATDNVTVIVNAAANQPPTANAGNNITITLPTNSTTLNGSGADADGTITSYAWIKVSGPATFTIGTPNAATTTLTNLVQGVYVFRLTVTDNNGATDTDDVTVTVNPAANQPPTANAGNNITITLPTNSTTFNGSGSDPDGTIASYLWTWVSGPATYTLGTPNAATTTLTNLVQGVYVFRLTVTDNSGATATDDITVTVNASAPANQAPIAVAGNNITLNLPANSTTVDGTASFDPDGTIVSYAWTKVSGTGGTIVSPNAAVTTLSNLQAGTYVFQLTVTDNNGATDDDNVIIVVSATANVPPVANAGNNIILTLPLNSTNLNGGGSSDPDGIITTYTWTKVSGPATYTISNANAAATGLTGLVQGVYVFRLTVTDNDGASSTDDVTVTVNAAANQSPVANAGSDITLTLPTNSTTLTGSGYDPDGTITTYVWTKMSGPATFTLNNANAASTGLTNLVQGVYVFRLTVTDNSGATATDNVTITVNAAAPPANQPPTANAGSDITLTLPTNSTMLTGSGYDADGTIASYAWSWVSGPATYTINSANTAATGLTNLVQGTYVFRLTVTDNSGATASDVVTVTVNQLINQAPTANAGADITITLPTNTTTLYGSGTDPDGTIASYAWSFVSGPAGYTIANPNAATTGLYNLTQGVYVFRLTITDNKGATASDNITVTVNAGLPSANLPPIARTENDITITLPVNSTQLHGNSSSDPDGVITTYKWTQLTGPTQSAMNNGSTSVVTVSNLTTGIYTYELKVTDDDGATSTKTIKVTVNNQQSPKGYIKVHPNPTAGILNIQYVENTNGKFRLQVYDANRRLMKDDEIDKTQVSITQTIDVSLFSRGVYFIEIISPDGKNKTTVEFVKM